MRVLFSTILFTMLLWGKTQAQLQPYLPGLNVAPFADPAQKWQLRPYATLQAGYAFFHGGISYFSTPAGVALVHPLNNNFSAFAGASIAPVAFSIARLYTDPAVNPSGNLSRPYGLGLNAGVQGGLIYTNDAKTFSISGSVELQRGTYPALTSPENKIKYHN